jgi:transposase InsO family protein
LTTFSNGICERFHRTIQEEFYATAFRKKLYRSLEELQADLDLWLDEYNLVPYCPTSLCC